MKRFLMVLVLALGFLPVCKSQLPVMPKALSKYTVIDTAKYVITYNVSIVNNPEEPEKQVKDVVILQIGNNSSKSYSNLLYQADSTAAALLKKGAKSIPLFQDVVPPVIVYKNYPNGVNTVVYRTFLSGPIFKYKEVIPEINWNLLPDKKTILGYTCQKATAFFRGRTYEAWFTPQIPLKEGPYKFDGLPGLILQIMDTQKHYIFDCVGIEKVKREEKIVFWNWMTQETSREKLNSLIKRFHEQPASVAESLGIKISFRDNSGNDKSKKSVSYPYNPIELE